MLEFLKNPLNLIALLTILTVLVAAHEFGHYIFARWFKMAVEEFAIGFGNPKWVWKRKMYRADGTAESEHETIFTFRPIPLGGFVRIAGMQPQEDGGEIEVKDGFYSKSPFARWMVLFAGPLFSFLAGVVILIPLFSSQGIEKSSPKPVIGEIAETGPAYLGGLRLKDRIISIDGKPINNFHEMVETVRTHAGEKLEFIYERDGKRGAVTVVPKKDEEPTPIINDKFEPTQYSAVQGKIRVGPTIERYPMTIGQATIEAFSYPIKMVENLIGIVRNPNRFKNEMGGPILIAAVTQGAVQTGMEKVFLLAGVLSISLGMLNLIMPFPPFDGGQMMIAFVEMLRRGRRLSYKAQEVLFGTGTVAAIALFIAVMWADIRRFTMPAPKVEVPKKESPLDKAMKSDQRRFPEPVDPHREPDPR